jgi:predicted nucleic acid-binding protein
MSPADLPGDRRFFVDTNVFLRFFTNDLPEQAAAADALFRRAAAGEIELVTNAMVLAEIVWVLESYYHLARADVAERAMAVALMEGLVLPEADLITEALSSYVESNVDFIDAFNAAWMRERRLRRVVTFDAKHYSRLDGMEIQPA